MIELDLVFHFYFEINHFSVVKDETQVKNKTQQ